jgi:hypothetical protein
VRSRVCQAKPIRAAAPASGHLLAAQHHVPAGFAKALARPSREVVCIHLTVHAFIGLPAITRRAYVLFPSRANADSPRRRVNHIVFDCPCHDAVRVRQTRFHFDDRAGRPTSDYRCNPGARRWPVVSPKPEMSRVFTVCMLRNRNADSKKKHGTMSWAFVSMDMVSSCPCSRNPSALPLDGWQEPPFLLGLSSIERAPPSVSNASSL